MLLPAVSMRFRCIDDDTREALLCVPQAEPSETSSCVIGSSRASVFEQPSARGALQVTAAVCRAADQLTSLELDAATVRRETVEGDLLAVRPALLVGPDSMLARLRQLRRLRLPFTAEVRGAFLVECYEAD